MSAMEVKPAAGAGLHHRARTDDRGGEIQPRLMCPIWIRRLISETRTAQAERLVQPCDNIEGCLIGSR